MYNLFNIKRTTKAVTGLTNELKSIYVYNRFVQLDESIVFLVNSLYEATFFYESLLNYTDEVLFFPMDDFLTSEAVAISPDLKIKRLETINTLTKCSKKIVVTNLMGYLRFLPPKENFINGILTLNINDEYNINTLINKIQKLGYKREVMVNKIGDFAIRGFVLDVYPINCDNPIRIEFWGDIIESIRIFDVDSQKTIKTINNVYISSNTEFLVKEDVNLDEFNQKDIVNFLKPVNISDYFENATLIINELKEIEIANNLLIEQIINLKKELNNNHINFMFDFNKKTNDYINLTQFDYPQSEFVENYLSSDIDLLFNNKELLNKQLKDMLLENKVIIICVQNKQMVDKLIEIITEDVVYTSLENIIQQKINIIINPINKGFNFENYVFISENDIQQKKSMRKKYKNQFRVGKKVKDITKIKKGDYVVHEVHGIAQYQGINTIKRNKLSKDYLTLEFLGNDKVYVPVEKIDYISKYSNSSGHIPRLTKLGGVEWQKTKIRIREKIENMAFSLLQLYAEREIVNGFAFNEDCDQQIEFEKNFEYTETTDQVKVIEEIKTEMERNIPMDRLLCGDVGFGKTEVAFRAMFKAVLSGKQVAFLAPTTILSNQHYNNSLNRFKNFAVNIALLNRYTTSKQLKLILKGIEEGQIDIVIGTHRLLSSDVIFKDLGLLVVDEEQRFGVKQKEKIKEYKKNIDILTLTATPIPRTLQMAFTGIRNLSVIETPPVNRYPIQTYVIAYNNQVIKEAVYKEKSRNGQVFILYNNVSNMERKLNEFKKILPNIKITYAHGQMTKTQMEKVMYDFYKQKYDVLLCTTIIETGIDIPTVNTLIIIDADHFGLSQLYQIRGRVGRSDKIAYCYLMYDKNKILTEIAKKRLQVIREFTELGSGFSIAMRDLSIRGAGDILGNEQAGFVDAVGIDMYLKLLNNEIKRLRGEPIEEPIELESMPLIEVDTSIDDEYVKDEELKIKIHKKINTIDSFENLLKVKGEIEDRFGKIDKKLLIYMYQEWFEKLAEELKIKNIKQTKNFIEIEIPNSIMKNINIQELFVSTNEISTMFRFSMKKNKLYITLDIVKLEKHFIYYLIDLMLLLKNSYKL